MKLPLLVCFLIVLACGVETAPHLVGDWELVSARVDGEELDLPPPAITLDFTAAELGGFSGCNSYGGPYTQEGTEITMGDIFSTLVGCLDQAISDFESAYLNALARVDTADQEGQNLLLSGAGVELHFVPAS